MIRVLGGRTQGHIPSESARPFRSGESNLFHVLRLVIYRRMSLGKCKMRVLIVCVVSYESRGKIRGGSNLPRILAKPVYPTYCSSSQNRSLLAGVGATGQIIPSMGPSAPMRVSIHRSRYFFCRPFRSRINSLSLAGPSLVPVFRPLSKTRFMALKTGSS